MTQPAIDRLMDAMRARPVPWTPAEMGECMGIHPYSVHPYVRRAVEDGRLIKHGGRAIGKNATTYTLGTGATNVKPGPRPKDWTPPKMIAPRPGTEVRDVSHAPPMCTGCSKAECWNGGCQKRAAEATKPATVPNPPPAAPARPTAPPVQPQAPAASIPAGKVDDFDAILSARTGKLLLVGVELDEDGRICLSAEQVKMVRRLIAWCPA